MVFTNRSPQPLIKNKIKTYFSYAVLILGIYALGSTLAANLNLGANSIEFGQGIEETTTCTGGESLTITPYSVYNNSTGFFYLSDIQVSHIPASCLNKEFIVGVQSANATLNFDGTNSSARIIYSGASTTTIYSGRIGSSSFDGEIISAAVNSGYGSFKLHITGTLVLADNVYSITIESQEGDQTTFESTPIEALNFCVSNLEGEYSGAQIIALLGFNSFTDLETAILDNQFIFHVAGFGNVPISGYMTGGQDASGTQELFCGNSSNNLVHTIDSENDSNGIFRQDVFLGGGGDDELEYAWNAIFYGGPGNDVIYNSAEGGSYNP